MLEIYLILNEFYTTINLNEGIELKRKKNRNCLN